MSEVRLIDANALKNKFISTISVGRLEFEDIINLIDNAPTVTPNEAEIDKIKTAISELDFDFGDYYDHTDEIIAKILSKIDEVMKNEQKFVARLGELNRKE